MSRKTPSSSTPNISTPRPIRCIATAGVILTGKMDEKGWLVARLLISGGLRDYEEGWLFYHWQNEKKQS